MKRFIFISVALFLSMTVNAVAGPNYVVGKISNITSGRAGLMVIIGASEVPSNCTGVQDWMLIKEEYKSMTALTLTSWTLGRDVVIYTEATSSGYCHITQVDPAES